MNILMKYFEKMKGGGKKTPYPDVFETIWSWVGSFLGIGLCALISQYVLDVSLPDLTLIIGSFGASAVLVYSAIGSPLAQPRNLVGGHVLSALVGVTCFKLFGHIPWFASALAVSIAIVFMMITHTLHPPGGATALIAVIGSMKIHNLGYLYALIPVGLGAIILLIVALLVNNLAKRRRYPMFWY